MDDNSESDDDDLPLGVLRAKLNENRPPALRQRASASTSALVAAWTQRTVRPRARRSFKAPRSTSSHAAPLHRPALRHGAVAQRSARAAPTNARVAAVPPQRERAQLLARARGGGRRSSTRAAHDPSTLLSFPSREQQALDCDALADTALTRDLPATFDSGRQMIARLRAALYGEVQHEISAAAKRLWRGVPSVPRAPNPGALRAQRAQTLAKCRRIGVHVYARCKLVTFAPPGRARAPARYYLQLTKPELERASMYSVGDLWLLWVGSAAGGRVEAGGGGVDFARLHARPLAFWSKWHGPSSGRCSLEMVSLGAPPPRPARARRAEGARGGFKPFDEGAPCVALRVGNVASLLIQLYTLDAAERALAVVPSAGSVGRGAAAGTRAQSKLATPPMVDSLHALLCGGASTIRASPLCAAAALLRGANGVDRAVIACARRVAREWTLNSDQVSLKLFTVTFCANPAHHNYYF